MNHPVPSATIRPVIDPRVVWLSVPVLAIAAAVCLLGQPILAMGMLGAGALGLALMLSVDWATYLVLFVIYSNVAVVAVKYHNAPALAANAVPALLMIPLVYYLLIRRLPVVVGPALIWAVLFAIVHLFGTILSRRPYVAWEGLMEFLTEGLCLYLLFTNLIRTPSALRGAMWSVLAAGCLMGGLSVHQQLTGNFEYEYGGLAQTGDEPGFSTGEVTVAGDVKQFRLSGPIGEKNRYAQVMLMLVPLGIGLWLTQRSRLLGGLALLAAALAGAGALLTFSRATIVAAAFVVIAAAGLGFVSRTKVAIGGCVLLVALLLTPQYRTRLASLVDIKDLVAGGKHSSADGALKGRATEMGAAALVFVDHPVVGVGPGMFRYYSREYGERIGIRSLDAERQAHCLPLDVAAENGLLGLICFLAIFGVSGYTLFVAQRRVGPHHPELAMIARAFLLVLACYFMTGLFLHFAFIRYFWLMLALADASALIALGEAAKSERRSAAFAAHTAS